MNPAFSVFIMINNFLHDIVIAVPLASGVAMRVIVGRLENNGDAGADALMLNMYSKISRIFIGSLVWISLGAIPRILTFTRFEWAHALSDHNIPGLIAKHLIIFAVLMAGTFLWVALTRRVRKFKSALC
jgi:hypothetical protein